MKRGPRIAAWFTAVALAAAVASLVGRELHPRSSEASAFDLDAPSYRPAKPAAGMSKGGFTGFGETSGAEGRTIVSGRVVAVTPDLITIETAGGQQSSIGLAGQGWLRRLEATSRDALKPGSTVFVRQSQSPDEAAAVLIIGEP